MPIFIDAKLLYQSVSPKELENSICVVVDILRATTSIVHALGHGARMIIPCQTIEQTTRIALQFPAENVLKGGERHGKLIEGFQLDNSPWSYTSSHLKDKTILFTTTNGTQAINTCKEAAEIYMGAFSNFSALVNHLQHSQKNIHVICAGTDGKLSLEDILFAGMLIRELQNSSEVKVRQDDETILALSLFQRTGKSEIDRLELFKLSIGGKNLLELGMFRDLERASNLDLYTVIPQWNPVTGFITI